MGKRAAIYCRLSQQGGRAVERQEQDGRSIAAEHGWQVVEVFHEWESASEFAKKLDGDGRRISRRKEWRRLLDGIEAGQFDVVIVWAEDRSNRDLADGLEFVGLCERAGVRLVLPSYDYDLADPEDRNRFYGEVLAAQREVARLSKRVRRYCLQEAQEGRAHHGGRRAFGTAGAGQHRVTEAQAERERDLIREAAVRIRDGDTLRGICLDWNDQGVTGSTGRPFTTRTLSRMLRQARLAGLREHHGQIVHDADGRPVRGEIAPILDLELWQTLNAILTDPARLVSAVGGTPRHLLTGMIYCAVCGAKLRVEWKDQKRYYICPSRSGGGRRCVRRDADKVDALIVGALFAAVSSPSWAEHAAERPADDPARPHHAALAQLTADIDGLEGLLAETMLAERQGGKPRPSVATLRRKLGEREAEADRHRAALVRLQTGRTRAAVPRDLAQVWPGLSLDRRRNILKAALVLPAEGGKGVQVHPTGKGRRTFDPDAITADWRA
jgi:DNA invertase Pin-like site-specific DNA recombinase